MKVQMHSFGSLGTRFVLTHINVYEVSEDFTTRALAALHTHQLQLTHSNPSDVHAYLEYDLGFGLSSLIASPGSQGAAPGTDFRLSTTPLPPPATRVDRTQCAEYKALGKMIVAMSTVDKTQDGDQKVAGSTSFIHLFVTAVPCASCVGVLRQVRALFPKAE